MRRLLMTMTLLFAGSIVAGCSSGPLPGGATLIVSQVKGNKLNIGGNWVPIESKVPTYCGCLVVPSSSKYVVYKYVGPGSPGPEIVAVKASQAPIGPD
jgi:hypothetical protein